MKKYFLVMLVAAACNTATRPEPSSQSKADLPSITSHLTQVWRSIDFLAVVDSVSVVDLQNLTEKDLLEEEASFWFGEIKKSRRQHSIGKTKD